MWRKKGVADGLAREVGERAVYGGVKPLEGGDMSGVGCRPGVFGCCVEGVSWSKRRGAQQKSLDRRRRRSSVGRSPASYSRASSPAALKPPVMSWTQES